MKLLNAYSAAYLKAVKDTTSTHKKMAVIILGAGIALFSIIK